jgi:hypothetical protein
MGQLVPLRDGGDATPKNAYRVFRYFDGDREVGLYI